MSGRKILAMDKVIERLDKRISRIPLGDPLFTDSRYSPEKLSVNNFHAIPQVRSDCTICFVDGGNLEVASGPNFVIELARLCFSKYQKGRKLNPTKLPQKIEFYIVCHASSENDRIVYRTDLVPIRDSWDSLLPDVSTLRFDSFDRSLMTGLHRASITRVPNAVRTFAEWRFAEELVRSELEEGDMLVRDGSLQTSVSYESSYANNAYRAALNYGVIFMGLSKTSTLLTSTGHPLVSAIHQLSLESSLRDAAWYYHPIVTINQPDHRAEMYVVKLHPRSEHAFRFEIFREQADKMLASEKIRVLAALASTAVDIGLPGYPYGLIDVDKIGRVQKSEKAIQEIQFMSSATAHGIWDRLKSFIQASNVHQLLNRLLGV